MEVINLKKLIDFSRRVVYYNFDDENNHLSDVDFMEKLELLEYSEEENEEMEDVLPYNESEAIFAEYLTRRTSPGANKEAWFIKDKDFNTILEALSSRMVSNIVRNLVNRGLVDAAFDSEKNDFVFWVKGSDDKTKKDKDKK